MAATGGLVLPRHERRRRASFVLTSLIDVIFLLVIFFMVSSQIVPYSAIPLGPVAAGDTEAPAAPPPPDGAPPPAAIRIQAGRIAVGREAWPIAEAGAALEALTARGITGVILVPTTTATVQDLVTVLEALRDAAISNVTVLSRGAGR